jgi:hypothetical protein
MLIWKQLLFPEVKRQDFYMKVASRQLGCPEDVAEMAEENPGGFGASSGHVSKQRAG